MVNRAEIIKNHDNCVQLHPRTPHLLNDISARNSVCIIDVSVKVRPCLCVYFNNPKQKQYLIKGREHS